jgi:hypothetical protein
MFWGELPMDKPIAIANDSLNTWRAAPPFLFGLFAALAVIVPLFGQSFRVSGRTLSLLPLVLSLCAYFVSRRAVPKSRILIAIGVLLAVYIGLVFLSANSEQFGFLVHPSLWSGHDSDYIASKLTLFVVFCFPPILLAVLAWTVEAQREMQDGLVAGFITAAIIGALILLSSAAGAIHTDAAVSNAWYLGAGRAHFSIISMGLIFIIGGLAALSKIGTGLWQSTAISIFVGCMIFGAFWLNRRIDTILFVIVIFATLGHRFAISPSLRKPRYLLMAAIPLVLIFAVSNATNLAYWINIASGLHYREEFAGDIVSAEAAPAASSVWSTLFGHGLGAYAKIRPETFYPHNLLLETFYETGSIAAIVLVALIILSLIGPAIALFQRRITSAGLFFAGTAILLIGVSTKSGDVTSAGLILMFAILASRTPSQA